MKKIITLTLIMAMLLTCTAFASDSSTFEAVYTNSTVEVNGKVVAFEAYNIKDNNYFKLRDVAMAVNGSEKQFEVTWNEEAQAVEMLSNRAYTVVGGELATGDGKGKAATLSTSKFYKDGGEITVTAYMINGNNYIKLRDLGKAFDFEITWDGENNRIVVDTSLSYTDVEPEKTDIPFYEGYPDVVDFGALVGISPVEAGRVDAGEDGMAMGYAYNGSEIDSSDGTLYGEKMGESGFVPVTLSDTEVLLFNSEGRAVLVVAIYGFLDVFIYETRLSEEVVYKYLLLAAEQILEAE